MAWAALLAGIAGYIDAICYLRLGQAFAANMTGNLVEIGIHAARGDWRRSLWCAAILLAFLLGVLAARLAFGTHRSPRLSLLIETAIVALAATGMIDGAAVPLLAAAMAMQNEAATHGVVAVNVAFVTGDIQRLGERLVAETVPSQRREGGPSRSILAVLASYALGAAIGTLAARWGAPALGAAAVVLLIAAALPMRRTQ